jgi:hypothetical protein
MAHRSDVSGRIQPPRDQGTSAAVGPGVRSRKIVIVPLSLSLVAAAGMILVGGFMSFKADAPGFDGSSIWNFFYAVGSLQFVLGIIALGSISLSLFKMDRAVCGAMIGALGLVSVLSLLVIAVTGTLGVLILAVPGVIALVAGRSMVRSR